MEEKKHCKWYNDEFCTNDKSPCLADYCPCVEYPELCKFREVAEDINVPNKDEKTIEFDDDVVDLLVEFDEDINVPNKTELSDEDIAKVLYGVEDSDILNVAYFLDEQGYRKIPEGAVVVSKQVWDEHIENWDKTTKAVEERVRKETAEKYHAEIEKAIDSVPNATKEFVKAWKAKNDEIAKEITEGENG